MRNFPQPFRYAGATRWAPGPINRFEESHGIELTPADATLTVRELADRYGVSVPTIWRWTKEARDLATGEGKAA